MSNVSDYHDELWKVVVKVRDRWCQLCGAPGTDSHHIFFRSQGNWEIIYDTDYGVRLCHNCHEEKPFAPHKSNRLFFEKIIPRLPEERAKKILKYKNSVKKPNPLPPQWKFISKTLRDEKKELMKTSWMDDDCEAI
jgi:hypothetical protein